MSLGDFFNDYIYEPVTSGVEWLTGGNESLGKGGQAVIGGDIAMGQSGNGLLASLSDAAGAVGDFYSNNAWAGDATAGAAVAALQYKQQKDSEKAQRELYERKFQHDMELQNLKNDQENERYWVQPGNLDRGAYTKGWVGDPLKEDNNDDKYKWRFR